jgi:CO/xanthine dehydrogenase FAD-binding subunit
VISIVMVAANLVVDSAGRIREALICVGSCSAAALRLAELERALIDRPARPGLRQFVKPEHLDPLSPIDDVRATAEYRRDAALTLVGRALEACAQKAAAV